jgi:hypothetical protein
MAERMPIRVWVIQRRVRSGDAWGAWETIDERDFAGSDAAPPGPMESRAWGGCTYYFADKSPAPDVGWRLWNTHTNEADPNDPFE